MPVEDPLVTPGRAHYVHATERIPANQARALYEAVSSRDLSKSERSHALEILTHLDDKAKHRGFKGAAEAIESLNTTERDEDAAAEIERLARNALNDNKDPTQDADLKVALEKARGERRRVDRLASMRGDAIEWEGVHTPNERKLLPLLLAAKARAFAAPPGAKRAEPTHVVVVRAEREAAAAKAAAQKSDEAKRIDALESKVDGIGSAIEQMLALMQAPPTAARALAQAGQLDLPEQKGPPDTGAPSVEPPKGSAT